MPLFRITTTFPLGVCLFSTACTPAVDVSLALDDADLHSIITGLSNQAPARSHAGAAAPPPPRGESAAFHGGEFLPTYTLRRTHAAPPPAAIRTAIVRIDEGLNRWAQNVGWRHDRCAVNTPLEVVLLPVADLRKQTGNPRIVGRYSTQPETIFVAFDADDWRTTLAHEMAHAAYARCGWGDRSNSDSEAFARAFETWENARVGHALPSCRGLFRRRRARKGLCQ